jgi:ferredoxin
MQYKVLEKDKIAGFLDYLASKHNLMAPVSEDESFSQFKRVYQASEINLNYTNTVVPPKNYFFPPAENLFSFSAKNGEIEIKESRQAENMVIFGLRPCDIKGMSMLDPVFNGNFPDSYYGPKREKTILIGLSCQEVMPTCFCKSFGTDPTDGSGADLMLTGLENCFLVEILTAKGAGLLEHAGGFFGDESVDKAISEKKLLRDKLAGAFLREPDLSGVKEILDKNFEHPYWGELAAKCIGCGICTFVCPTCHCFNMIDTSRPDATGSRYRCHDSCMFPGFTKMAGGHNPRPTRVERVRNRFMHKLKYHLDRYNLDGCSGCGRCIAKCPVNIDISQIITHIREVVKDD